MGTTRGTSPFDGSTAAVVGLVRWPGLTTVSAAAVNTTVANIAAVNVTAVNISAFHTATTATDLTVNLRSSSNEDDVTGFYVGLLLAITSTIFIGASFIIKKKALLNLTREGGIRAGSGGFGYLKNWMWWAGLITMGVGEAANFTAYAFAPAALITPLGALSVLVSAVLAARFLDEKLNLLGKLGCLLCVLGSTVIVIHAPHEEEVESLVVLVEKLQDPGFLAFEALIMVLAVVLAFYVGPAYGHRHVVVYILLCSSVGSMTVLGCKGLGLAIKEAISGRPDQHTIWLTLVMLVVVVACIMVQMNYLNRALDLFKTNIVTPVYYVLFTSFVVVASGLLFKEWENMSPSDYIGSGCGFLIVIMSIILLNTFKDLDLSAADVRGLMRPGRELLGCVDLPLHTACTDEEDHESQRKSGKQESSYCRIDLRNADSHSDSSDSDAEE